MEAEQMSVVRGKRGHVTTETQSQANFLLALFAMCLWVSVVKCFYLPIRHFHQRDRK
jgi:hypothetical protein